ncbi:hypothetical protein LOTGIDRAFT_231864 [Lottia gigantea]|uniref:Uncharacterized protein n=1 Tax=Lottia gigantea TaxID=225164 RepID=V4AR58_LOTGI|nr:hypothetical protein LOTGIDRAFT_231864 [Lottia gigantea]ESO96176.1 hypothetical protein LOTGIDRAFT_231864 [Lottia gigantea]
MLQRRRSSIVTSAESHDSFVNRSRQLIRVTRDQIVKLNDMSTEVREMTERLFSEEQSYTNRSSRRRSSVGVRFESHHVMSKRRTSKTISMKLPPKKQSKLHPRKNGLLTTKDAKDGTENSDVHLLEVNGTSSIEAAKAGFVGLEKQVNETTQRSRKTKESETNETKGRNFFGYSSIDKARYVINENGSAQQRKNAAVFEYKFRSQRPTLQLPQINLSTDELSPLLTAPATSTPRSESPNSSRVDAWNSRALIMFGNNYDKFIRNRTECIPFRCAAFNRQQKQWY